MKYASSKMIVVAIKWTLVTFYDMYLLREIILPILEMAYFRFLDIYDVISVIFDENTYIIISILLPLPQKLPWSP